MFDRPHLCVVLAFVATLSGCGSQRTASLLPAEHSVKPGVIQNGSTPANWTEFPVPTASSEPWALTVGKDKNVWFTEANARKLARVTPDGIVTEFPLSFYPTGITKGGDGKLYIAGSGIGPVIGQATITGSVTVFNIPGGSNPTGITKGADGNVWFADGTSIGRITSAGVVSEFPIPSGNSAEGITTGSDGAVWFTEGNNAALPQIGRIDPSTAQFAEYPLMVQGLDCEPTAIVTGSDSNLWFPCHAPIGTNQIVKFSTSGVVLTAYASPYNSPDYFGITLGPDGAVWFSSDNTNAYGWVVRVATNGGLTGYATPGQSYVDSPVGITSGADGNLWVTTIPGDTIDVLIRRIITVTPSSISFSGPSQTQDIVVSEKAYSGGWSATSSDQSVATVSLLSKDTFAVTSVGSGSATITVADTKRNSYLVNVSVP